VRELFGLAQPGLLREPADDGADVCEVNGAGPADRGLAVVHLEQQVDERAPLEVLALEPLAEEVEDREQLVLGRVAASARLGFHPVLGPDLLALLQEGEHEVVLGGEVPVQRGLCDLRPRDHLVDADRPDALAREEVVRAGQDAVARGDRE
jgi:hypothetical protein